MEEGVAAVAAVVAAVKLSHVLSMTDGAVDVSVMVKVAFQQSAQARSPSVGGLHLTAPA